MHKRIKYAPTFGGFEGQTYKNSKAVVLPVPYDKTSSYGKGADKGPAALISASPQMEYYDREFDTEAYAKYGLHTLPELKVKELPPEKMFISVYKKFQQLIKDNKFVGMIGGEHSITPGAVRAMSEKYDDLSVLHWDAHGDLRESYEGTKYSHACSMKRSYDYVDTVVQVGIRSISQGEIDWLKKNKFMDRIYSPSRFGFDAITKKKSIQEIVGKLRKNVYISIDLDGFDPSFLPATGTPEPGGLNWYDCLDLMREIFKKKNVVGFDVNELAPIKGLPASEFMAALLVYKLFNYKFLLKK